MPNGVHTQVVSPAGLKDIAASSAMTAGRRVGGSVKSVPALTRMRYVSPEIRGSIGESVRVYSGYDLTRCGDAHVVDYENIKH